MKIIDNYQNIGNSPYDATIEENITSQIINVSSYSVGIYTVAIFRDNLQVAGAQLLIIR